jgi:hypothetical protein
MAEEFKPEPIMDCSADKPDEVSTLAHNVVDKGLYANAADFPDIPEPKNEFTDDLAELEKYRNSSKGNSDNIKMRDYYSKKMHNRLKNNLNYAKIICSNNVALNVKTGYPISTAPEAATAPLTRQIVDIVKGPEANTVHIILEKASGTKKQRKERKTYIVRVSLTEDATEYTIGCISSDSRKLFVSNVPSGAARYYKIVIQNTAASNELASKVKFTLV